MFVAIFHQSGGCDYTIGCGIRQVYLTAFNMCEAKEEATVHLETFGADVTIDSVTIYEVIETDSLDIKEAYRKIAQQKRTQLQTQQEAEERAQLARLQAKYGK